LATAKTLAADGYRVYAGFNRNVAALARLEEVGATPVKIDVTSRAEVECAINRILTEENKLDVVVYSVSSPLKYKPVFSLDWSDFQGHLETQLQGFFHVVMALRPAIEKGDRITLVVVLTDTCLQKPPRRMAHYVAAKYALMGFVKSLVSELSKTRCTLNMVSPGLVETDLISNLPAKARELEAQNNPMRRLAEPEDVARVIGFLASEDSDYLNGVNMPVNGGNIL